MGGVVAWKQAQHHDTKATCDNRDNVEGRPQGVFRDPHFLDEIAQFDIQQKRGQLQTQSQKEGQKSQQNKRSVNKHDAFS